MSTQPNAIQNKPGQSASAAPDPLHDTRASATNAKTHGLTASLDEGTLVPHPDRPAYNTLLEDLRQHLTPTSSFEHLLVERLALLAWKLRLHAQAEAHLLDQINHRARKKVERANRRALKDYDQHLAHNKRYRIKEQVEGPEQKPLPEDQPAAHLLATLARTSGQDAHALELLKRYETATQRAFDKALHQYQALKSQTPNHHHFHHHHHTRHADTDAHTPSPHPKLRNEPANAR